MALYLGLIGTAASFLLLFIGLDLLHLSRDVLQSFIYLKLSIAGHLTIFIARSRGHFWSYKPGNVLVGAVFGTQVVATLIAVYGFLIPPIGWNLAALVWIYALALFLITDQLKVRFYKLFDEGLLFMEDRLKVD
jgi:H+-transporting ATPase